MLYVPTGNNQCHHTECKSVNLKRPLSKRPKIGFQDQLSLNAGQKYCRMLQREHSAILFTFIKGPFVIKILIALSIFEWPFCKVLLYTYCIHFKNF